MTEFSKTNVCVNISYDNYFFALLINFNALETTYNARFLYILGCYESCSIQQRNQNFLIEKLVVIYVIAQLHKMSFLQENISTCNGKISDMY